MLRTEDIGEIAYGGIVTATQWWDEKRITAGTLVAGHMWKKYSTYAYLGIGVIALGMSAFGWMRRYGTWAEHVSHGFLYALPGFAKDVITSMTAPAAAGSSAGAIAQANQILAARRAAALALAGGRTTERTYIPEMEKAHAF